MRLLTHLLFIGLLCAGALLSSDTQETTEEPLETFEPTERLPADSAVSFPVDI